MANKRSSDDQSQSPPKRRKKFDFKESAVGTVQEMYLENFMCHEQLRVAFGPHLNIITGRNGSGKSAILAGLQVCLGASARATNRGNKIGDLVRNDGGNRAYVSVRLSNRGSDAFEPRTYGTEITVERSIAKKGASTFKVKNDRGKVISTSSKVVRSICEKFNIQVDNPVCILDQQSAKSFIQGKDDAKYKFFLKATELEKLQEDYIALKEQLRIMKNNMEVAKRGLPKLQNQRDELETKLKKCEELERSMADLKSCEASLEWASVREMEQKVKKDEANIEKLVRKKEKKEENSEKFDEKVKELEEKMQTKESESEPKMKLLEEARNERTDRLKDKRKLDDKVKKIERSIKASKREVKEFEAKKNALEKQLEEIMGSAAFDNTKLKKRLEDEKTNQKRLREQLEEKQNVFDGYSQRRHDIDREFDEARQILRNCEADIRSLERDMKRNEDSKTSKVSRFGGVNIARLVRMIANSKSKFRHVPVGPIGMHVNVENQKWNRAVEFVTKNLLTSFVVDNSADKRILDGLARSCNLKYGVRSIISKFGRRNEPPVGMLPDRSKYTTVADVIKVDNDQAWNALLDHCSIERIVLFDDPAKAERVMKTGRKNVMRAVMEDGMIVEIKNGVTSNFANRQASQPLQYINANVKQLNEDLKGRIVSKKRELDRFKIDFKNAEKKKKDLQNEVRGLKNEIRTLERKEKACDKSIASVEREIENMQAAEDDREDPSQVKDEIRETEVELKVHVKELEKLNLEGNEMKKKRDEVVEAMKKCSVKIDEIEKSVKTNVDEVARLEDDLDNLKTGHERVKEAITKFQRAIRDLELAKRSKEREIAKEVKVLERRLGVRPESEMVDYVDPETKRGPKSVDALKKLIRRLQKLIKSREKTYSRDEVKKMRARFEKLDKRYQAKKARFDIVNTRHGGLKAACSERHERWIGFREKASKKTAKYFKKLLQHRGSTGELTFDHEDGKTLNMQLCMDVNQTEETILASQVTNTSALSGGERSSVTLALLMALGETIDCPFRLMDELDVYMDPANRQMLMDVIARAAERHFDRQVIMLTPNNIDGMLKVGDDDDDEATMRVLMPENLNILTLPSKKKRGN